MSDVNRFLGKHKTVTCIVRAVSGRNGYGNATYTDTEIPVHDCLVAPAGGQEDNTDADRVVDSATVYNLSGTWPDDSAVNRVLLEDGTTWEIDGAPQRWPGAIGGVVIQLRKVRG